MSDTSRNIKIENIEFQKALKPQKEKRALTFLERIEVIQKYETYRSARILSQMYGCGKTQILNIMRNKDLYLEQWHKSGGNEAELRRKSGLFVTLSKVLYEWIQRATAYPEVVVTDDDIKHTAKTIARIYGLPTFYPHNYWLNRFKAKYGITDKSLRDPMNYYRKKKSLNVHDIINEPKLKSKAVKQLAEAANVSNTLDYDDYDHEYEKEYGEEEKHQVKLNFQNNLSTYCSDDSNSSYEYNIHCELNPNVTKTNNVEVSIDEEINTEEVTIYEDTNNDEVTSYEEALEKLKSIEDFLLMNEDLRGIGLINQLENHFKDNLDNK